MLNTIILLVYKMATVAIRRPKPKAETESKDRKIYGVYMRSVLNMKVILSITEIGKTLKQNLESKIVSKIGGKCISDGYIKPNSIKLISYSSGAITSDAIEFHVIFECMVCMPVEGMLMECTCKTVTKAGIHANVIDDEGNKPVTVFIARDHHYIDDRFQSIKENTKLTVKVIGIRFELNDLGICVIAKLTDVGEQQEKQRPRLNKGGDLEIQADTDSFE
jgi:DNA-directed RNA polymerase subunit E'/Rpb7